MSPSPSQSANAAAVWSELLSGTGSSGAIHPSAVRINCAAAHWYLGLTVIMGRLSKASKSPSLSWSHNVAESQSISASPTISGPASSVRSSRRTRPGIAVPPWMRTMRYQILDNPSEPTTAARNGELNSLGAIVPPPARRVTRSGASPHSKYHSDGLDTGETSPPSVAGPTAGHSPSSVVAVAGFAGASGTG